MWLSHSTLKYSLAVGLLPFLISVETLDAADEPARPPALSKEVQDAIDALKDSKKSETPDKAEVAATHKQARSINPKHDGQKIHLHTYCLDETGDIWACVGTTEGFVQHYSPEGELKAEIKLDFIPTAINTARDLDIFVAGNGKMARLTRAGEIKLQGNTANLPNPEEFKKQAQEEARAESETMRKLVETNIARVEKTLEKVTGQIKELTDKEEEVPKSLKTRLSLYERQLTSLKTRLEKVSTAEVSDADIEQMMAARTRITALAVTEKDLFVCVTGNGYEVWRSNHDFTEPTKVLDRLSGCCGQMDIQASGDQLLVAANTKFQVAIHDRDGTPVSSFGKRDREAIDGFGSCCNPMNIRCCSNGDVLCAESSIGNIKRFNAAGELVGYIGKAKIGIGCKHVAVAHDDVRDRYYMMNVDKGNILVLMPLAEVPEFTEEELASKAATEGLGKKLIGEWTTAQAPRKANRTDEEKIQALTRLEGAFNRIVFQPGGKLTVQGGMLGQYSNDLSWAAVRQEGEQLAVSIQMSGADWLEFQFHFSGDDEVQIKSEAFPELKATRAVKDADVLKTEEPKTTAK